MRNWVWGWGRLAATTDAPAERPSETNGWLEVARAWLWPNPTVIPVAKSPRTSTLLIGAPEPVWGGNKPRQAIHSQLQRHAARVAANGNCAGDNQSSASHQSPASSCGSRIATNCVRPAYYKGQRCWSAKSRRLHAARTTAHKAPQMTQTLGRVNTLPAAMHTVSSFRGLRREAPSGANPASASNVGAVARTHTHAAQLARGICQQRGPRGGRRGPHRGAAAARTRAQDGQPRPAGTLCTRRQLRPGRAGRRRRRRGLCTSRGRPALVGRGTACSWQERENAVPGPSCAGRGHTWAASGPARAHCQKGTTARAKIATGQAAHCVTTAARTEM